MNVYIVTDYIGDKTTEKEIMFEPKFIIGIYSTEDAAMRRKELEERRAKEAGFDDVNKFHIEPWKVLGSQCHNLSSQCNNLSEDEDIFVCSLCNNETHGFMVDDFGMTVGFGKVVSRCPNCGAEVVRYAEQALKEKFHWVIYGDDVNLHSYNQICDIIYPSKKLLMKGKNMNNVWVAEWVCYPNIDGYEERYIEKVFKSKGDAIEYINNDEDFEDNFLIIGEDSQKFFDRHREGNVSHYEISCWNVD